MMLQSPESLGSIACPASDQHWTSVELAGEVARRAALLASHGVGADKRVLLSQAGSAGMLADLLAVWRLGACAACVNPGLSEDELRRVVTAAAPTMILVGPDGIAPAGLTLPVLTGVEAPRAGGGEASTTPADPDAPALILYTSGTTGDPKGVMLSFRALEARLALNRQHIGDAALARSLCLLPTHFGHGLIGNCLTPLLAGQHLVLAPGIDLRAAADLAALLTEHRITFMSSVPSLWSLVLKLGRSPASSHLHQVSVGSAPLSAALWSAIADWSGCRKVVNMYGMTETANWIAGASAAEQAPEDGLIGAPWGGAFAVMSEDDRRLDQGRGELLIQSPSVMLGYRGQPEATAAVLRDGWLHSGDVAELRSGGVARLIGRIKHEINRAGAKVHPEDVDRLLQRHPAVLAVCSFGLADAVSGEIVAVAVQRAAGSAVAQDELRDWCRARLHREAVPERWFFLDLLPLTASGKVDRNKVIALCGEAVA